MQILNIIKNIYILLYLNRKFDSNLSIKLTNFDNIMQMNIEVQSNVGCEGWRATNRQRDHIETNNDSQWRQQCGVFYDKNDSKIPFIA